MKGFFTGNGGNWPICIIDVRDVAEAHLQAVLKPEANGQRFLLTSQHTYSSVINNWIYERHNKTHPAMKLSEEKPGDIKKLDNQSTKDVLGIEFADNRKSVEEMSDALIANKYYD